MTRQQRQPRPAEPQRYRVVWPSVWSSERRLTQGEVVDLSDNDAAILLNLRAVEPA